MPVYEENGKTNGQKRYFVRTYVEDIYGNKKQITRHNKDWIGKNGYWLACQEEIRLKNEQHVKNENLTINDLFDIYFKNISETLKPSSIRKEKDNFNIYIKPFFKNKIVYKIQNRDVIDFHTYLNSVRINIKTIDAKKGFGEHELSLTYKQSIHTTLNSMLNFACKYINLPKNVASNIGNFKRPKGTAKNVMNFLTEDEFKMFITNEDNYVYKTFYTILFYTGMRRGELLALTKDDIDLEKKEIRINKSINPKNGILATIPKTSKSNRTIKMINIVYDTLKEYTKISSNTLFGLKKIKTTTLQRKCDKGCINVGIIKKIRIHDFRHSFASMCINKGVPIEVVSEYLGHESISTTLETYAHLYPNAQEKLLAIMN